MENILRYYFDTVSEEELAGFEKELESIANGSPAGDAGDILGRAVEKAGFRPKPAKRRKHRLLILIAAAVVILATVGFVANFNKLDVYFGIRSSESPFVGIFGERGASVSNNDLTLSVDGAFSDEMFSHFLISLTAQTREGRRTIDKIERAYHLSKGYATDREDVEFFEEVYGHIDMEKLYNEGKWFQTGFIYDAGTGNSGYTICDSHYFGYNTASAFYFELIIDKTEKAIDPSKPMKITEAISGLSVEADMTANLKTVKLISDDPAAYKDVTISPLKILIRSPEDDPFAANKIITDVPSVYSEDDPIVIFVHKKDGTTVEGRNAQSIPYWKSEVKEGEPDIPVKVDSYARLSELTMLEDIDHVTILGIDYRLES
ncbi:MAG: DUF4179 domain-containing protein [Ruminococcus sp.]|nr:DUF4179 domain-containing protein [Ruminococcus sp.]